MIECWAFLRTMAHDYSKGSPYPPRRLGPDFNPHLRCPLMLPTLPHLVVTFKTRRQARFYARGMREHGHAIKVRISWRDDK
ncbi:MAG: hypothetical protein A2Y61_05360 [Chloroflexi bacterium RBG_13_60_13]|nr:MAG: hypothetical protein A2Y61_05360 [Chloroflexi bacterium RBG_13_60_13]